MIINKIEIEFYQEADNEVGSEDLTVTINPVLIGLYDKGKISHYYTFKTEHGFSFNDKDEVFDLFNTLDKIVENAK